MERWRPPLPASKVRAGGPHLPALTRPQPPPEWSSELLSAAEALGHGLPETWVSGSQDTAPDNTTQDPPL